MKKALAILLALLMILPLAFTASAATASYTLYAPSGMTDVLFGKQGIFTGNGVANTTSEMKKLTDGVYTNTYYNQKWANSITTEIKNNPTVSIKGVAQKYLYTIEYDNLPNVSAGSCVLYFEDGTQTFSSTKTDNAFDIYISVDSGATYQRVFSSSEACTNTNASTLTSANGLWTQETVTDTTVKYWTAICNFDKLYENVTNIVYACVKCKTNHYCTRISEFDVYSSSYYPLVIQPENGRTDIISGKTATVKNDGPSVNVKYKNYLTDGTVAYFGGVTKSSWPYYNAAWSSNATTAKTREADKQISYPGITDTLYEYAYEYNNLGGVTAKSFSLFHQDECISIVTTNLDAEFHILISCDGGNTYSKAYESTKLVTSGSTVISKSSDLKTNGGDWEKKTYFGREYLELSADLDKVYTNVTNVVYACVYTRRSGVNPTYYPARLTEFDVYSAIESTANVTFEIANGTFATGSSSIVVPVTLYEGSGTLSSSAIPAIVPDNYYESGSWDTVPDTTENAVTGNITYTYTCAPVQSSAVVRFEIENGCWQDSSAVYEVSVHTSAGVGTLSSAVIPTPVPNKNYELGSWDTEPDTSANAVTGNITYTYTCAPIQSSAVVRFEIENGRWQDSSAVYEVSVHTSAGVGTLSSAVIPTPVPNKNYELGSWDTEPDTSANAVTGNITYTYTCAPIQSSAVVRFEIENGCWQNSSAVYEVSVATSAGIGTLSSAVIPTPVPSNGYLPGYWVTEPDTRNGAVTGNITYKYICIEKTVVQSTAIVTFVIENGKWQTGSTAIEYAVTTYDGYGTLPSSAIPTPTADSGYDLDAWISAPNTADNAITGDVTYTYSCKVHIPVQSTAIVTFVIENGTWQTGSTAIEYAVTTYDGYGTLPSSAIPTPTADSGYDLDAWISVPDTADNAITGDVTYTYSCKVHIPVQSTAIVTFVIENGKWQTGSTAIEYAVTTYDGYGTLPSSAIPTPTADSGYDLDAWDVAPDTADNAITGDVTYIYTCKVHIPVQSTAIVTFVIENGKWQTGSTAIEYAVTTYDGYGTLPSSAIPTPTADSGYDLDAWISVPDTADNAITGNVTYTYSCKVHIPVQSTAVVTFVIQHGTWVGGSSAISVNVTTYDGYGTLPAAYVPAPVPDSGYDLTGWDVTPATSANAITGDVTYTYSCHVHIPVQSTAIVSFVIENGTWPDGSALIAVPVTMYDGCGTLPQNAVPVPAANKDYQLQGWITVPDTSTDAVTADVTYVYYCSKIPEYVIPELNISVKYGTALADINLPFGWLWESNTSLRAGVDGNEFYLSYSFYGHEGTRIARFINIKKTITVYDANTYAAIKVFNAYRSEVLLTAFDCKADTDECRSIISATEKAVIAYVYDTTKDLGQNMAAIDAIIDEGVAAHKKAEGAEETPAVIEGDINGDSKVDIFDMIKLQKDIADNAGTKYSIFDLIRLKKQLAG